MYVTYVNNTYKELVGNIVFSPTVYQTAESLSGDQRTEFGVYLLVEDQPPLPGGKAWGDWTYEIAGNTLIRYWHPRTMTTQEQQQQLAATVAAFDIALTAHLDSTAQQRRYDNRITCMVRAGFVGPFQAEGKAFATWCDSCNAIAYQMLAAVQAGTEPMPESPAAFIATLPAMVWPT